MAELDYTFSSNQRPYLNQSGLMTKSFSIKEAPEVNVCPINDSDHLQPNERM